MQARYDEGESKRMESFVRLITQEHAIVFARTFVGLVLLAAGVAKLSKLGDFVGVVRNYRLLPEITVPFVGRALPAVEAIVAIGLLFGILVGWLALAAVGLFLLFGSAVAINLLRGRRDISCGCFWPQPNHHLTWGLVTRNAGLAGLAVSVWLIEPLVDRVGQLPIVETVATMFIAGAVLASLLLWGMIIRLWGQPEGAQ